MFRITIIILEIELVEEYVLEILDMLLIKYSNYIL